MVETDSHDFSESRRRRLLELKLLHHYNMRTGRSLSLGGDPTGAEAWTLVTPDMAFENDALLYSLFALSALHMAEAEAQKIGGT